MARNLRVLRIDDIQSRLYLSEEEYTADEGDGFVCPPLELMTFPVKEERLCLRIGGLQSAVEFWTMFSNKHIPDIIVSDIDFQNDRTSPLINWNADAQHIPTGLSHLKPFAAIARAIGTPISIAMHTGDQERWALLINESNASSSIFGYLAAHEIVELAAILDDNLIDAIDEDYNPVWDWLRTRTTPDEISAIKLAVEGYRKKIITSFRRGKSMSDNMVIGTPLGEWNKLFTWCQKMYLSPIPLEEVSNDIGLPILYSDGRKDKISFASLFADVDSISTRKLPARCFDPQSVNSSPWLLNNGLPQIGALISELGEIAQTIIKADMALKKFPLENLNSLDTNLHKVEKDHLARGFAIIFRTLEILNADEIMWGQIWNNESRWDPVSLQEPEYLEECRWARSLHQWVTWTRCAVVMAEQSEEDDWLDAGLVRQKLIDLIIQEIGCNLTENLHLNSVVVHLEFLEQMGQVESISDGGRKFRMQTNPKSMVQPQRPDQEQKLTNLSWRSNNLPTEIAESIGFLNDDNAVGRMLSRAFQGDVATKNIAAEGRTFFKDFIRGHGPPWLKEVCREYCCTNLNWDDDRSWPSSIRVL